MKASVETTFPQEAELLLYRGYKLGDETAIFDQFVDPPIVPEPGFVKDFIGVRARTTSLWKQVQASDGRVFPVPIPCDYHCETIEWLGLLRSALDGAKRGSYRIIELGAGIGMWSVIGGVAARRKGVQDIRIYAVEGDPLLCNLADTHFKDNDFGGDKGVLIKGAVGAAAGMAKWPKHSGGAESATYNFRPILDGETDYMKRVDTSTIDVRVFSLQDLLAKEKRWDLAHFDIQGHEADVIESAIEIMTARVHRIVIGTHSRMIEARLFDKMRDAGWILENEKPCKFSFAAEGEYTGLVNLDGTQIWRNVRIALEE